MAGLDTSIALGIRPIDLGDPNEGRMNALRSQLLQQQMQMGQFNMMKAQRDMQYQDQQRAQAAATAARDKAAEAQALALYNKTGAPGYQSYAPSVEPGAASDVGMLGSGQGYTEGAVNRLAVPATPKNFDDAIVNALQSGKLDVARKLMAQKEFENAYKKSNFGVDEAAAKTDRAKSEASSSEAKAIEDNLKPFRAYAASVNSPEAAAAYVSAMFDHPVLGSVAQKISGQTKDQAVAAAMRDYAADPQRWMAAHVGLTGEQVMSALQPKETEKIPELKKGEVWNPEAKRVEAVPGSSEYVAQTQKHEKDYKGLLNVENSTKGAEALISNILDPQNEKGLENSFGGYGAYATQYASGNTAKVQALLDQLKSVFRQGGLKEFRQGGSIGAMTEKEWPIVADMIGKISPKMDVEDVKTALRDALNKIRSVKDVEREAYDTTWGKTQYHKPIGNAAPAPAGAGANPHASKTDEEIRKELGLK